MKNSVQITVFREAEGTPSVRFETIGEERYALVFYGRSNVTLYVPDAPQGKLKYLGQALIVSRHLCIDFRYVSVQTVPHASIIADDTASLSMVKALKHLCNALNTYFTERAAFYWDISPADCHIKDAYISTAHHKIAYYQLLEIDAAICGETRKVA
ncbi:hypothetical protein KK083_21365 [Fulvivirgaceae bacterium PWU4]|uniref:Uncharacterized protein n=1 Tax=Chryseosolibacter histidini TaxID=2782349 RepID=A0AAP2DNC0_9BACT|nr:hypothetical protein [Chryseosolibacter histidini]MBT1699461.1 hypothetical protein [Chryseosolibacter histidini]